jgi:hypothetical protein
VEPQPSNALRTTGRTGTTSRTQARSRSRVREEGAPAPAGVQGGLPADAGSRSTPSVRNRPRSATDVNRVPIDRSNPAGNDAATGTLNSSRTTTGGRAPASTNANGANTGNATTGGRATGGTTGPANGTTGTTTTGTTGTTTTTTNSSRP